jgi:hypothetical protein
MAMSRSLGGTPFTTRSPILISPEVTLSRPAIMASKVDLPQPEGPTSTTNSPVETSRLMPFSTAMEPKDLLRLRIVSEAMSLCYLRAPWVRPRRKYRPPKK